MITTIINKYLYNKCNDEDFDDWYKYNSTSVADKLKYLIRNKLTETEKRVILLYIEYKSYRKVAEILNISVGTAYSRINNIKKKILKNYDRDDT